MIRSRRTSDQADRPKRLPHIAEASSLAGRFALVTGASSGIGKAIARALAKNGASLALIGRHPELLHRVVDGVVVPGAQSLVYPVDLAVPDQIADFAARFVRDAKRLDILVHSAAVIGLGTVENASVGQLDWQWSVNLRAPYLLTQTLLPWLKSGRGQIVFINSTSGLEAGPNSSQYSATKHALKAIANSLRQEVNDAGVRVLNVFVGRTATPMQARVHAWEGRPYVAENLIQPDDVAAAVLCALSLPRSVEITAIHLRPMTGLP